jgi:hypothetical protein
MSFYAIVGAVFLVCGSIVTYAASRLLRAKLTIRRFTVALLAAMLLSGAVASGVVAALTRNACGSAEPCESAGVMEGGVVVVLLWLLCYSVIYLLVAFLIAYIQSRKSEDVVGVTPNNSLQRP